MSSALSDVTLALTELSSMSNTDHGNTSSVFRALKASITQQATQQDPSTRPKRN